MEVAAVLEIGDLAGEILSWCFSWERGIGADLVVVDVLYQFDGGVVRGADCLQLAHD